jgi:hypothetical protein
VAHDPYPFFNDAPDRASPAGMKRTDGLVLHVYQKHRQTVRGLNAKSDSRQIGNQSVAYQLVAAGLAYHMNHVGVDLTQRYQRPGLAFAGCAQGQQELPAISLHVNPGIVFGEAKVEAPAPIASGGTA